MNWSWVWHNAATLAVGIGVVWAWLNKHDKKLVQLLTGALPKSAQTVITDIGDVLGSLAKSPWFAAKAAQEKLTLEKVLSEVSHLNIITEAQNVLLTIGSAYEALDPAAQVKAQYLLKLAAAKVGVQLSDAQVSQAFADIQAKSTSLQAQTEYQAAFPTQKTA